MPNRNPDSQTTLNQEIRTRFSGLIDLTRYINAVAAALLTGVGAYIAGGLLTQPVLAGIAVIATGFGTAGGNAINDYFDRSIDKINQPDRPIPRGDVTPRDALFAASVLLLIALVVTVAFLPRFAIVIGIINLFALISYTPVFKGRVILGNLAVAYLGGSTFLFGGAAVGNPQSVAVLFFLAALATLAREILKDVEDVNGDRFADLHTLPLVVGESRARIIALILLGLAVLLSPLPYFLDFFGVSYLVVVAIADVLVGFAIIQSRNNLHRAQLHVKYAMFVAGVAFIVGRAI